MERSHLLSLLAEERRVLRQYGVGAMLEDSLVRLTMRALGSGYTTKAVPRLKDLYNSARSVYACPREAARDWAFDGRDADLRAVSEEFALLRDELDCRSKQRHLVYPPVFGMQE